MPSRDTFSNSWHDGATNTVATVPPGPTAVSRQDTPSLVIVEGEGTTALGEKAQLLALDLVEMGLIVGGDCVLRTDIARSSFEIAA